MVILRCLLRQGLAKVLTHAGIRLGRPCGSFTKTRILRENRETVIRMLRDGNSIAAVCRNFNVSRETFSKFRKDFREVDEAVAESRHS